MSNFLETIKAVNGEILNIKYHQKRYENVLKSLGFGKCENLLDHLQPPKDGVYKCRIVYNSQEITTTYERYTKKKTATFKLIFNNDIEYSKKSTERSQIDNLYAKKADCDEILIIKNLLVTDTSIANTAFYDGNIWLTPKTPLLKGTTRARLLEEDKIVEAEIKVQQLRTFTKVALLNAMIEFDVLDNFEFLV